MSAFQYDIKIALNLKKIKYMCINACTSIYIAIIMLCMKQIMRKETQSQGERFTGNVMCLYVHLIIYFSEKLPQITCLLCKYSYSE